MNKDERSNYQSYLIRLWRDDQGGPWRASLKSTATGETHAFGQAGSLLAFLAAQIESPDREVHSQPAEH